MRFSLRSRQILIVFFISIGCVIGMVQLAKHSQAAAITTYDIPIVESLHPYPDNLNSFWVITNLDPGAKASRVHFSRIELEEDVDYIVISDAYDKEFQRFTEVYTDGIWTDPIPGNEVKIRLVSDSSVTAWGFAADQVVSVDYDSLASSTHPYSNNSSQEWLLGSYAR